MIFNTLMWRWNIWQLSSDRWHRFAPFEDHDQTAKDIPTDNEVDTFIPCPRFPADSWKGNSYLSSEISLMSCSWILIWGEKNNWDKITSKGEWLQVKGPGLIEGNDR